MKYVYVPASSNVGTYRDHFPVGINYQEDINSYLFDFDTFPSHKFNPVQEAFLARNSSLDDDCELRVYMYKVRMPEGRNVSIFIGLTRQSPEGGIY